MLVVSVTRRPASFRCPCRYTGVAYDQRDMRVQLGDTLLMDRGQPLDFDAVSASEYLKDTTAVHGTVRHLPNPKP